MEQGRAAAIRGITSAAPAMANEDLDLERAALDGVTRAAALARLEISATERPELARQFARILAAFESLGELDVAGVEPMTSPIEAHDIVREDRARTSAERERLLANAPQRAGEFFGVPKTVGGER